MTDIHYKEIPRYLLQLTKSVHFRNPDSSIWEAIERVMYQSLHMFSNTELITIYTALGSRFPKLCSTQLRSQILKLLKDDFDALTVPELIAFICSQNNNNQVGLHNQIVETLKKRHKDILNFALNNKSQSEADTLANVFYAYMQERLPRSARKTRGIENDEIREAASILDLFLPRLTTSFNTITTEGLFRLCGALEASGIGELWEVYSRMERILLRDIQSFSTPLAVEFIRLMSRLNGGKSAATPEFWQRCQKMATDSSLTLEPHQAIELFQVLASQGVANAQVQKVLLPHVGKHFNQKHSQMRLLKTYLQGLMFAGVEDEQILKEAFIWVSKFPRYVPARFFSTFQQFRLYLEKRHPEWNYSFYDNRCYHAKTDFVPFRSVSKAKEGKLMQIYTLIGAADQLDMKIMYDWEGLYIVDISLFPHKVGAIIDYGDATEVVTNPKQTLKKKLLEENGWDLVEVKFEDFLRAPSEVAANLAKELREVST